MFTTVPRVAPAPGRPWMNPAIMLPMPWPTSSRFGLWRVRVIESATSDVNRLSMEPSSAMINAGCTDRASYVDGHVRHLKGRQSGRHLADDRRVSEPQDAQSCSSGKRGQCRMV